MLVELEDRLWGCIVVLIDDLLDIMVDMFCFNDDVIVYDWVDGILFFLMVSWIFVC